MDTITTATETWLTAGACRIEDFVDIVAVETSPLDYPLASAVEENVVIYDCDRLRAMTGDPTGRRAVQAELIEVFLNGPGIAVFRRAFTSRATVDRASDTFRAMIADQHARGTQSGDHYAKPGANDRVWNALEKQAVLDPEGFVDYYSNDIIALVCEAWLGPGYQVTSQVNVVNPGGAAQSPHRDYHLGFTTIDVAESYAAHIHQLSPVLTLQGAIAHCEMPVESGPTLYLPHSQKYVPGYVAWRLPDFKEYFAEHHVQLPLSHGDMVFFNPAMFHAAGENRTADVKRMANLLQVSSAFGRAMENVDRTKMATVIYPALLDRKRKGMPTAGLHAAIAAAAEGYAFPSSLDRDPPLNGLSPESPASLVARALDGEWDPSLVAAELAAGASRRLSDEI